MVGSELALGGNLAIRAVHRTEWVVMIVMRSHRKSRACCAGVDGFPGWGSEGEKGGTEDEDNDWEGQQRIEIKTQY